MGNGRDHTHAKNETTMPESEATSAVPPEAVATPPAAGVPADPAPAQPTAPVQQEAPTRLLNIGGIS